MILLLDTHILLWAAYTPQRLPKQVTLTLDDPLNQLLFSAASIWEIAIKAGMGRAGFTVDAKGFRRALLENGYGELPISGAHASALSDLKPIHRDPFDRILVAQAKTEGIPLLTADKTVARYGSTVQLIHPRRPKSQHCHAG